MPTVKLTARTVEAARPPASGRLELFDEDLPGFCIRVTSNGRRTACVFYRVGPRLRPERPRERVLADEEIKKLWQALDTIAAGDSDPVLENGKRAPRLVVAGAVKLLLLVGTRRSETLNMRWADVDERAQTWTVPGMFRKGGRTHVVPLSHLALRILADLRPISGETPWVFVGKRGASLASNPARWTEVLRKASGLDFTLHDLRRTCATGCARLGASESTVSRILGHKAIAGTIAVSGIYDRFDRLPEIRSAVVAWSNYVEVLVRDPRRGVEVVAFMPPSANVRAAG